MKINFMKCAVIFRKHTGGKYPSRLLAVKMIKYPSRLLAVKMIKYPSRLLAVKMIKRIHS
jgi:hypothetical protein